MHPRLKLAVMYNSSLHCECDFFSSWPSTTTKKLIACFSLCLPLARSPRYCTYCACAGSHTRIPTCTCTRHQLRIRNPSFILFFYLFPCSLSAFYVNMYCITLPVSSTLCRASVFLNLQCLTQLLKCKLWGAVVVISNQLGFLAFL